MFRLTTNASVQYQLARTGYAADQSNWLQIPPSVELFIHNDLVKQLTALGVENPVGELQLTIETCLDSVEFINFVNTGCKVMAFDYQLDEKTTFSFMVDLYPRYAIVYPVA